MRPICIVGPTASGKTNLALSIAQTLMKQKATSGVVILSADSKQVYMGLDIVTGKDIPSTFKQTAVVENLDCFVSNNIHLFGIDVVDPTQEWSVAHFLQYARRVIAYAKKHNYLLIVAGGTGQYIQSLLDPPATATIPRDETLRVDLALQSVEQLQQRLQSQSSQRFEVMNASDRFNSRRLVRAIEVEEWKTNNPSVMTQSVSRLGEAPILIGLDIDKHVVDERIATRVHYRLQVGAIDEVKQILGTYPTLSVEAKATLGVQEIMQFLEQKMSLKELEPLWTLHEIQYAKRQKTWFAHMDAIIWLSALAPDLEEAGYAIDKIRLEYSSNPWYTHSYMDRTRVEISIKTIVIILLTGIGLYIFTHVTDILTQIFIAFVLMTALNPVVSRLVRLRMSRPLAILTTYLLFIGLMVVAVAAIVPPFIDQTTKLFLQLRIPASPVLEQIQHLQFSAGEMWSLLTRYGGSLGQVFDIIISTFSVLFTFFTILVMSVYLLIGRDHLYSYFTLIFRTSDRKERSKKMLDRVEQALGSWVRGEFILMVSIGIMTYIGLLLLNIPYALPLAIFAGLMEALPNLGPTIAAIPAVIVAAVNVSPVMGGVTAILYMVIQQVENNFVVPQVMKRATGIRPLTTIVLILIGIRFAGIAGALLIVPLYIVIREVLLEMSPEIQEVIKG